ncbi:hypothetical protein QC762_401540 [Podospora pseudocomata]|uniref:2EXR domain-containing protein n=1 Tax=Podospora pseudocomata TaxID=2093779 RepID=A0ABR0GEG6_9PEZI|nr:hypothetical protein QC762_401540 [Podospora pseudocomata]
MAETFPRFPRLPYELRHMIWEFAIRPAAPGAHIFTISDSTNTTSDDSRENEGHVLVCQPRCDQTRGGKADGQLNNPSTYIADSGLWTACRESRNVMERKLLQREDRPILFWGDSSDGPPPVNPECWTNRQIALFPTRDLIILQSQIFTPFRWTVMPGSLDWDKPTYRQSQLPSCAFWSAMKNVTSQAARHIAVEYNPAWDSMSLHWGEVTGFVDLLLGPSRAELDSGPTHVWFIDYRLKRRNRVSTEKQLRTESEREEPRVYYGDGCRYVEVSEQDSGESGDGEWNDAFGADRWHPFNNEPMFSRNGVRGCVKRAKALLYKDEEYVDRVNIGILACESL